MHTTKLVDWVVTGKLLATLAHYAQGSYRTDWLQASCLRPWQAARRLLCFCSLLRKVSSRVFRQTSQSLIDNETIAVCCAKAAVVATSPLRSRTLMPKFSQMGHMEDRLATSSLAKQSVHRCRQTCLTMKFRSTKASAPLATARERPVPLTRAAFGCCSAFVY